MSLYMSEQGTFIKCISSHVFMNTFRMTLKREANLQCDINHHRYLEQCVIFNYFFCWDDIEGEYNNKKKRRKVRYADLFCSTDQAPRL